MRYLFILVILLLPFPVAASDLPLETKVLLGTALTLHAIDYNQTSQFDRYPNIYEGNSLLGRNPSQSKINRHFAITTGIIIGGAYLLNSPWRELFLIGSILIGIKFVNQNQNLGIGIKF